MRSITSSSSAGYYVLLGGGVPHRGDAGGRLCAGQHLKTDERPPHLQCDPTMGDAAHSCR